MPVTTIRPLPKTYSSSSTRNGYSGLTNSSSSSSSSSNRYLTRSSYSTPTYSKSDDTSGSGGNASSSSYSSGSSSRFGVSRYTKSTILDRDSAAKPPTGSSVSYSSSSSSSLFRNSRAAETNGGRIRDLSLDNNSAAYKTYGSYSSGYQTGSSSTSNGGSPYHHHNNTSSTNNTSTTKRQSSSSLARSVATSGADLYEKYSPSKYIPKVDLPRSRSLSESSSRLLDSSGNSSGAGSSYHHHHHHSSSVGLGGRNSATASRETSIDRSTAAITTKVKPAPFNRVGAANNVLATTTNNNNLTGTVIVVVASPTTNTNKTNKSSTTTNNIQNFGKTNRILNTSTTNNNTNINNNNINNNKLETAFASDAHNSNSASSFTLKQPLRVATTTTTTATSTTSLTATTTTASLPTTAFPRFSTTSSDKSINAGCKKNTLVISRSSNNSNNNNNSIINHNNSGSTVDLYKLTAVNPPVKSNFLESECNLARNQVINQTTILSSSSPSNRYAGRQVKPAVQQPRSTLAKKPHKPSDELNNNNMNCLQKSPELLDDIKYIDSDDSERKHSPPNTVTSTTTSKVKKNKEFYNGLSNGSSSSSSSSSTTTLPTKKSDASIMGINKYNTIDSCSTAAGEGKFKFNGHHHDQARSTNGGTTFMIYAERNGGGNKSSSPSPPPPTSNGIGCGKIVDKLGEKNKLTVVGADSMSNGSSVRNASLRSTLPSSSSTKSESPSRSSLARSNVESRESSPPATVTLTAPSSSYNNYRTSSSIASTSYSDKSSADDSDGLCGLRNIGNTCFMNSVLQCLSHTRELTHYLKTTTDNRSTTKDQRILYEFSKLIRDMWTPRTRTVTPSELKSAVSSKHRMYSGCGQQDAQEFLRFFLDSLHNATNTGVKGEKLEIDDTMSDNMVADRTWEWYTKVENSVIQNLFVGQFKSSLKCTVCGNTSVTFDPFWDLSVPLQSSSKCKLESCLDFFIKEEVLDGDEMPTCSKCKARRKSTKSFTIQRFPKYLVIHLKRFSETRWSKMTNIVEFPTGENGLDMAPYAANSSSAKYSLYGISNHMGSTAGGHYVALCKHPVTKKWHEFNDNMVSDASESGLVSSSAYLLFYERA